MKLRAILVLAAAGACLAGGGHAQRMRMPSAMDNAPGDSPAPPPSGPPTPAQIAAAKKEADRIIARAKAGAWFTNITDGALPKVRHTPSGLECAFTPGQQYNEIRIAASEAPKGEDVICQTEVKLDSGMAIIANEAAHYPQPVGMNAQLDAMAAQMRQTFVDAEPDKAPYDTLALTLDSSGVAMAHAAVRYHAYHRRDPDQYFERAAVGVVAGWVVIQRVTAPFALAQRADLEGELSLSLAVAKIQQAQKAAGGPPAAKP